MQYITARGMEYQEKNYDLSYEFIIGRRHVTLP